MLAIDGGCASCDCNFCFRLSLSLSIMVLSSSSEENPSLPLDSIWNLDLGFPIIVLAALPGLLLFLLERALPEGDLCCLSKYCWFDGDLDSAAPVVLPALVPPLALLIVVLE